jgi:hypothetical protein
MNIVVAVLGLVWAAGNLLVAYEFITSAFGERMVRTGPLEQALPLLGGIAIGLFAVFLIWNCARLVLASGRVSST